MRGRTESHLRKAIQLRHIWEIAGVPFKEMERIFGIYLKWNSDLFDEERYRWVMEKANYCRRGKKLTRRQIIRIINAYQKILGYIKSYQDEQKSIGKDLHHLPQESWI